MATERNFTAPALRYPRSFLGLLVAGLLLVALPLAAALLYSAWHTERLAEQSRNAVFDAAQAARVSRSLVNRISSIERLALQLVVLPDPALRADLARVHSSFKFVALDLSRLPLDAEQAAALDRTVEREQALFDLLESVPPGRLDARAVRDLTEALAEDAYQVLAISYVIADREVERLRSSADDVHRQLVALVLVAIALALAAALLLTRLITRPIAALDSAIRQLGGADFERPIHVGGPADLQSLGERLDWLRQRLTELEAQKSRFLRHLSHDLKTPLAALREGTELLSDQIGGPLAPPQRQVIAILRDNSVKLQRMIEELLDYQRVLHIAAGLEIGPVALELLLQHSVQAHRLAADAKRLKIELDAAPIRVRGDAGKLRSIVDNLIGNAVKFTPHGGTIRVTAREQGEEATIDILDTGPGVAPEEREAIFEAFFRGRTGGSGRAEGIGLGLAIAREFSEAHGGRIEAIAGESGGHFRVTLPLRPAAPLAEAA